MPELQRSVMQRLYGVDIWDGYLPTCKEPEIQGWNGNHSSLSRLATLPGSKVVIDVGVWKGQSTINMAAGMRDSAIDGVVIAVDTFLGSPEHWPRERIVFSRSHGMPDLYSTFTSNVFHASLADYVVPMPQTSATAARILKTYGIKAAVVHVDAAHEYREARQDFEDYWDLIQDGGFLIGDDYDLTWPGIVQAAGEFSAKVRRPLAVERPKFIIQK
jgi:hypothetical protein